MATLLGQSLSCSYASALTQCYEPQRLCKDIKEARLPCEKDAGEWKVGTQDGKELSVILHFPFTPEHGACHLAGLYGLLHLIFVCGIQLLEIALNREDLLCLSS